MENAFRAGGNIDNSFRGRQNFIPHGLKVTRWENENVFQGVGIENSPCPGEGMVGKQRVDTEGVGEFWGPRGPMGPLGRSPRAPWGRSYGPIGP